LSSLSIAYDTTATGADVIVLGIVGTIGAVVNPGHARTVSAVGISRAGGAQTGGIVVGAGDGAGASAACTCAAMNGTYVGTAI